MTPLECVRKVIECDNGRDQAGYRALLHDDYVAHVHGNVQTEGGDQEAAALAGWWKATPDSHLEELATVCQEYGRHHFLLEATPEPFVGATGAPVNPIAIF